MKMDLNFELPELQITQGWDTNFIQELEIRLSPRFLTYRPNLRINIETSNYHLKTATTMTELLAVFKLRYDNFLAKTDTSAETKYDVDEYDHLCDHLIIQDKTSEEIVGTYRVFCSKFITSFYSQDEFEMSEFLSQNCEKIELGRACIEVHHRNGNVIDLLWKGIMKYMHSTSSRYLFGCTSVYFTEPEKALSLYRAMEQKGWISQQFNIEPTLKHNMNLDSLTCDALDNNVTINNYIPPLLKSYITAGAKIHGYPALDRDLECVDFLTILDIFEMSSMFKRRYMRS